MNSDECNWAWAAGLFEGEGSVIHWWWHGAMRDRGNWQRGLTLTMTDEDIVRRFHRVVGAGRIVTRLKAEAHYKPQWEWRCTRWAETESTLRRLLPWLGKRRKEAAEALLANPANPHPGPMANYKTHCVNGHAFTEENSFVNSRGRRGCRTCARKAQRAYYQRQKEKVL